MSGLISMTPSSVAATGSGSEVATINADGGCTFTDVTSVSVNGVFTSDYGNYLLVIYYFTDVAANTAMRLRASGTDATGGDYDYLTTIADGATASGTTYTGQTSWLRLLHQGLDTNGFCVDIYGPQIADKTAVRSWGGMSSYNDSYLRDTVGNHTLTSSYDGLTIDNGGTMSGALHVYGYGE